MTVEEALAALDLDDEQTVEVRGTVHSARALGRQTINRWPLDEAESTLTVSELTRVDDDPDGCRIHAATPGGRIYRFAAT